MRSAADYERLADLLSATARKQDLDPAARADMTRWSRVTANGTHGVPAQAFPSRPVSEHGRLRQRDFDLGRGIGFDLIPGGPPTATAVLLTLGDRRADWLRSGQALQRLLLHAASAWVFASLYTQPLESAQVRNLVKERLALPGFPQMVLQFGHADSTRPTSRRSPADLVDP